jgi:hypothetical protein
LNDLLRQDFELLCNRLDSLSRAISAISDKIDLFREVSRALRTPSESVSEQALAILKVFDHLQAQQMIVFDLPPRLTFLPNRRALVVREVRFLATDVAALATCGLIDLVNFNGSGNPIYALTRAGARVASSVSDACLPKEAATDAEILGDLWD